ncbi:histone-lysine N-methyltransferase 2C-like isoform X2 [Paramacrobiotus metropolitanus]|uniref:histone-lysine N-methyltransferase 2C-like isoform X2 n=1 Tax=Paramacrobiotus metropolitanus TaxID=2943436 RepID=UPI0024464E79|nr:histone-lysine N-methyltransferase 2C-like isoform X2 [Paramacrobiotus metropolitanus]
MDPVMNGDIILNHHPPIDVVSATITDEKILKIPKNSLFSHPSDSLVAAPPSSQITTFNFSTSTKLLVRTKRVPHVNSIRQEAVPISESIPKSTSAAEQPSVRKELVVKKAEIVKLACALCQLSSASRFGQGSLRSFPVSISSEQVFQLPNSLKEKQQLDDLAGVGHEQIKSIQHTLSEDGELMIHEKCLQWSPDAHFNAQGVCTNPEEVVSNALLQLCAHCGHYGASVRCSFPECTATYHLPCSSASDCYQQLPDKKLVCSLHFSTLPDQIALDPLGLCFLCGELDGPADMGCGSIKDLLFCHSCGKHAHPSCLGFSAEVSQARKAGWQCSDCRTCCVCRGGGKTEKVVVCSDCGHDYHLTCLVPPLGNLPKSAWKCPSCRICRCGKRTPGAGPSCKWHHGYTLCDSCYQQKIKGSVCPVCQKAYRFAEQRDMLRCSSCGGCTHRTCDEEKRDPLETYECVRCRKGSLNGYAGLVPSTAEQSRLASLATNQQAGSPSSSSVFSSSLDESSLTEQGSEVSGSGGGKPSVRLKRRQTVQSGAKNGKKRSRTLSTSLAPPVGRKRGKGKSLPLIIPKSLASPASAVPNGEIVENGQGGDAEEDSVHTSTVVIFKTGDDFMQLQDICVSCGAIGLEDEGKLIGCAQCGQCYHSFCAGVKLNSAVLTSGWRCLDCTLCEVCGKPHDEGRLILCDECDISFHIYCLSPPLNQVPSGTWKCRRCVRCQYCDSASPGYGPSAQWHNNYSTCTPCASLQKCPVCESDYVDKELVIQCLQCDRFLHAACDAIMDEDDVESAFSMGYICPFCRPDNYPPLHLQHVFEDEDSNDCNPEVVEPKAVVTHKYEGMLLSDAGLKHLKRLSVEHTKLKSPKKKHGKLSAQNSVDSLLDGLPSLSQENDKMEEISGDDKRKRIRRPQRFGVGGFVLRGSKPKAEKEKELGIMDEGSTESHLLSGTISPAESLDNHLTELAGLDPTKHPNPQKVKKKKVQSKKRFLVKDMFPDYLQDAFFGKALFDSQDSSEQSSLCEKLSLSISIEDSKPVSVKSEPAVRDEVEEKKLIKTEFVETFKKMVKGSTENQSSEEEVDFPDLTEGFDALLNQEPLDEDLGLLDLEMLMAGTEHEEYSSSQEDDSMQSTLKSTKDQQEPGSVADNLDSILDSLESDLPQMSSEDAEDVFNNVFLPSALHASSTAGSGLTNSRAPLANGEHGLSTWSAITTGTDGGDSTEAGNGGLKTQQKWEQDEALGPLATVSSVLYANLQHPDLKQKFPDFSERYKQILKLWRKVSTNERQPFLHKARDNRAANKATKTQRAKASEKVMTVPVPVKVPERPTTFGVPNLGFVSPSRFQAAEPIESPFHTPHEEMLYTNPATPSSQPSTPGSSASHAHHQPQPYHVVGSPAPPFSPPLERPRSVLPMQHHVNDPAYGVQSPHSYQQVQSPRTPFPPSSPFDPYAHPPASVQPVMVRQQSHDHAVLDEHDPYSQPPGTPMPQRFQQPFMQASSEPQSPQNGQFFPRQQLRDLLNRQNQVRQRQPGPPAQWQYPQQQEGFLQQTAFPSPQQVQEHNIRPPHTQTFPVQRQEFRHPPPPQTRMIQQAVRSVTQVPEHRYPMPARAPTTQMAMQRGTQPNMYGDNQNLMYEQPQRHPHPQWQQSGQIGLSSSGSEAGMYGRMDCPSQPDLRMNYVDRQFVADGRTTPAVQPTLYAPVRNPTVTMVSASQSHAPMQWSQPQQRNQQYPSMPGRPPSVMPTLMQSMPVATPTAPLNNTPTARSASENTDAEISESERHNNMTHESFLLEHHQRLAAETASLQENITRVRKQRKALAARQRQLRKNNSELSPEETMELERLTSNVGAIQKRLETVKKDYKQHQSKMQDFAAKTGVQLLVPVTPAQVAQHPGEKIPAAVISRPQLPSTMGAVKMDPLHPNALGKTAGSIAEIVSRSDQDGRTLSLAVRSFTDANTVAGNREDDKSVERKNILLKQLLENGSVVPPVMTLERKDSVLSRASADEGDESSFGALTPAQQQQLALIESMPLTTRKDSFSSSPMQLSELSGDTLSTSLSQLNSGINGVKKEKGQKKRKKKAVSDGSADSTSMDGLNEAVVDSLLEQLRQAAVSLCEPDKSSLPVKSVFLKPETDAAPVPVGKKLEDLKKPQKRILQGSFGQYELTKQGTRSRFCVGVTRITDETASLNTTNIDTVAEQAEPEANKSLEADSDKSPNSPAMSYISTSSYGENHLLEPCYDHLYNWLEIGFPPDGPPSSDIIINEPTLAVHFDPATPGSLKENFTMDMVKYESITVEKFGRVFKESDRVNVSMTITEEAACSMGVFLQNLANLLRIPVTDIEMTGCDEYPELPMETKPCKYCRTCEIALDQETGFRKRLSDLPVVSLVDNGFPVEYEDGVAYVSFCSSTCMMQFAITNQNVAKVSPPATVSVDHGFDNGPKEEARKDKREHSPVKRMTPVQLLLKSIAPLLKKGKKGRHELWSPNLLQLKRQNSVTDSRATQQVMNLLDVGLKVTSNVRDNRVCVLCHLVGDLLPDGQGRLLNIDGEHWVHLNCALWSVDVYETNNGHLMNVQQACKRGAKTECVKCRKLGATLLCYHYPKIRCNQMFHFPCAKSSGCMFFNDKSVLCETHKSGEPPEDELKSMIVHRRVYVHRDEPRMATRVITAHDGLYSFRIGTLIFHSLGQLYHSNMDAFHNPDCVYPVGYSITRIFWSMRALHKRCFYHCTIHDVHGAPDFRISVEENGYETVLLNGSTTKEVWMKVLVAVLEHRSSTMIKVFPDFFTGDDLFGLTESNIARAIECLPGINEAIRYQFKYEKARVPESPAVAAPVIPHQHESGSARTEPKLRLVTKRAQFGHHAAIRAHSSADVGLTRVSSSGDLSSYPLSSDVAANAQENCNGLSFYQKQTLSHTKINQYRKMKAEWRSNVYLARSKIEGLGLFAARDLDKNSMIIEYVGELIRNEVANHRERMYEMLNHAGIYMFRVDNEEVCDASRAGGPARFINHSCDPNCITEVVQTDKNEKKIVISSLRRIFKDEELCYDYKFDFEDDQHKIPCNCGASNCNLWMN